MEVEQKFITKIEELSHVKGVMVEVQRKAREELKKEFEGKMMEMQRQVQVQAQLQEQMMQQFQK